MEWKRQVRIVGCFHPHHAQKKGSDHPSEGFAQGSLDPGRFQQLGLHCHQLCALEGLHVQLPNRPPGPLQGRRKVGQPTSHPLFPLPWQAVQRAGMLGASWPPPLCKPSQWGCTAPSPFSMAVRSPMQLLEEVNAAGTNKQPLNSAPDMLLPKFSLKELKANINLSSCQRGCLS